MLSEYLEYARFCALVVLLCLLSEFLEPHRPSGGVGHTLRMEHNYDCNSVIAVNGTHEARTDGEEPLSFHNVTFAKRCARCCSTVCSADMVFLGHGQPL